MLVTIPMASPIVWQDMRMIGHFRPIIRFLIKVLDFVFRAW